VSERDKFPKSLFYGPFKDVEVLVIAQDTKIAPVFPIPSVHHLLNLNGSIAQKEPHRTLVTFVAGIAFHFDFQCCPSLSFYKFII
jgi:hypothetical protein